MRNYVKLGYVMDFHRMHTPSRSPSTFFCWSIFLTMECQKNFIFLAEQSPENYLGLSLMGRFIPANYNVLIVPAIKTFIDFADQPWTSSQTHFGIRRNTETWTCLEAAILGCPSAEIFWCCCSLSFFGI